MNKDFAKTKNTFSIYLTSKFLNTNVGFLSFIYLNVLKLRFLIICFIFVSSHFCFLSFKMCSTPITPLTY